MASIIAKRKRNKTYYYVAVSKRGADCPVERVRWEDVQEFVAELNGRMERLAVVYWNSSGLAPAIALNPLILKALPGLSRLIFVLPYA